MSISTSTEHIVAAQKSAFDSLLSFANTSLDNIGKLNSLVFTAARSSLADHSENAASLLAAHDLPQLLARQGTLSQPQIEKTVAYWRSLYDLSAETQEALVKLLESQHAELNRNISSILDWYAKSSGNGEVSVAAIKSAISAANSAFESANKAARKVANITGAGVSATVQAVGAANQSQATPRKKAA